jgi:hypothetical protein
MTKSINLVIILFIILAFSCKEEPTKPSTETNLTLEVLDKSCTEVWIDIKANDQATKLGSVYLNDEFRTQFYLKDTLVYLDELLPNKTYTIKLTNQDGIGTQTEFTTMDTTSHNFTWETFTFGGEGGSSYLRDVAIINENDIWAVGEIYTKDTYTYDSNGVFQHPYNAVHWDGNEWELKRIFVDYRGQPNFAPLEGVFALPDGKIIFSSGLPYLPEGDHWKLYHLWDLGILDENDGSVTSIWGTSLNDLYFVGRKGTIVHYNGSSWSKIESGTDLDLYDIWGDYNEIENHYETYCVAAEFSVGPRREIIKINSNTVQKLSTDNIPDGSLYGIWFQSGKKYYVVGNGIYSKQNINNSDAWKSFSINITPYYTFSIRGTSTNNLFICGSYGEALHFNGVSFKSYREMFNFQDIEFYKTDIRERTIVAVGYNKRSAFLIVGKK